MSLLAFLSARKSGFAGKFAPVRWGSFLGVLLWFLGELTWSIYEVFLHVEVPYPSVADVFYLAGYVPVIVAVIQFLWFFRRSFTASRVAVGALSGLLIVGLTSVLVYPLSVSLSDALTKSFDVAYPMLDAVLTTLAVLMFLTYSGGLFAKPWVTISAGLVLVGLYDIMFSLGTLQGWYYSGHPIELLYAWGYIGLGLGFDHQRKQFD